MPLSKTMQASSSNIASKLSLTIFHPQIRREFLRFTVVGVLATVADFAVLTTLTSYFHWHYLLSNTISFGVGNAVSYFLSVSWVFNNRRMNSRLGEFLLFLLIGIGGLGISQACMYAAVEFLKIHYTLGKLIAVAMTLFWNYGVKKACLFREQSNG